MADKVKFKAFPTAFNLAAIKRLEAGEAVLPLARELGVSRKLLHDWRKAWDRHGPAGSNRKRGPKPGPRKLRRLPEPAAKGSSDELAQARVKIAELERKIGQQALDIDFFHKALRALDAADRQGSIVPVSQKSSKPWLHPTPAKLTFNISASPLLKSILAKVDDLKSRVTKSGSR